MKAFYWNDSTKRSRFEREEIHGPRLAELQAINGWAKLRPRKITTGRAKKTKCNFFGGAELFPITGKFVYRIPSNLFTAVKGMLKIHGLLTILDVREVELEMSIRLFS